MTTFTDRAEAVYMLLRKRYVESSERRDGIPDIGMIYTVLGADDELHGERQNKTAHPPVCSNRIRPGQIVNEGCRICSHAMLVHKSGPTSDRPSCALCELLARGNMVQEIHGC